MGEQQAAVLDQRDEEVLADAFRFDVACRFGEVVEEEKSGEKKTFKKRDFSGQANSGEPFPHWWYGQTVIDLESLTVGRQDLPVLRDHSVRDIVGFTEAITVSAKKGIQVQGTLFDVTPAGVEVMDLLDAGAPMQMSVYVPAGKAQILDENEEAKVNGKMFVGPGAILRNTVLREVTITALGADENTSAAMLGIGGGATPSDLVTVTTTRFKQETPRMGTTKTEGAEPLDAAKLKSEHPDVYASVLNLGRQAERERVSFIYARAKLGDISDELRKQAIDEGWDEAKTADKFLVFAGERREARLNAIREERSEDNSVGTDDGEVTTFDEANPGEGAKLSEKQIAAMEEGEAKFQAEYDANLDNCRDDFPGDIGKAEYFAYRRHPRSTIRQTTR